MFEQRLYLDLYERETLAFIFGRTSLFFKEWETIPLRHFMEGVRSADGATVMSPIAMSETKLLESLKHLEHKGIIEVRRHPVNASQYRIRAFSEIDQTSLLTYMQRHQPKQYQSIIGRHFRQEMRPTLSTLALRNTRRIQEAENRSPKFGVMDTPYTGERVTPNLGEHNTPIINTPIPNTSNLTVGRVRRSLSLPKAK